MNALLRVVDARLTSVDEASDVDEHAESNDTQNTCQKTYQAHKMAKNAKATPNQQGARARRHTVTTARPQRASKPV